jgi:Na+-translocating ferredoxin:NAD+ oxidoreductase subunit B
MDTDLYERLAQHLDALPGGFPRTASGVEMRILRRLFRPEQAELALRLTLLAEEPRVSARRAGITTDEAARRLEEMDEQGLLYSIQPPGGPPRYQTQQFVIGIWEHQVDRLDADLVRDFQEYHRLALGDPERWRRVAQLRTVPVSESIAGQTEVLPYERAEELVRGHHAYAVANCICRQEQRLAGAGCDKPQESCLVFGTAAHHYVRTGRGRAIDLDEALAILHRAEQAGLVLQAGNDRQSLNICCCCGCCCGVLRALKRDPRPAGVAASPFQACLAPERCEGCGLCVARCPMEALVLGVDRAALDLDRCIGCGLCAAACPNGALALVRRAPGEQQPVPPNIAHAYIHWLRARGTMGYGRLLGMVLRSGVDRLLARR